MRFRCLSLVLLILAFPLFSQEEVPLQQKYLLQELETATVSELRQLAEDSGLSSQGNRNVLIDRLKDHYNWEDQEVSEANTSNTEPNDNVDAEELQEQDEASEPMSITIESAYSSRSIEVKEKSGSEILLEGRVVLRILQPNENIEHQIHADRIVFSQINDRVSASGNIHYVRKESNKEESFYGDSLTFQLKGWKGIIFNGLSQREDKQEGQTITFFFKGDQFKTGSNDTFVMENALITSGDAEEPTYQIKARKIWILGPQEWGMFNGALYIGRVPLLYLPFYYRPGNEMIINPVAGYREREGAFIQTTTYFMGRKKTENQSFFNAGLVTDEEYTLERQGLFLFKGDKLTESEVNKNHLKLMLDYYNRLGIYTGLEGNFKPGEQDIQFRVDAGYSRSINNNNSLYYPDNEGQIYIHPNHSYFYGLEIPFRWSIDLSYSWKRLDIQFEYMSDSHFSQDFHNRRENFDWLNWLLEEREKESDDTGTTTTGLKWSISYPFSIKMTSLSPWISRMDITSLSIDLAFKQKEDQLLKARDPYDPGISFFYPSDLFPRMIASISGTLLDIDLNQQQTYRPVLNSSPAPPAEWDSIEKSTEPTTGLPVEPKEGINLNAAQGGDIDLSWNFRPVLSMKTPFEHEQWESAQDINWQTGYAERQIDLTGSLKLNIHLFDQILSFTEVNSFSSYNKEYLDLFSELGPLSEALESNQNNYNSILWNQSLEITLLPLKMMNPLSSSYIKYNFKSINYSWDWDNGQQQFEESWFSLDNKSISDQSIKSLLKYKSDYIEASGSYNLSFFPEKVDNKQDWNVALTLNIGPFSQSVNRSAKWDYKDQWTPGNWVSNSSLSLLEKRLSLNNEFNWNSEKDKIESNQLSLNLWFLKTKALWKNSTLYDWDSINYSWDEGKEEFHFESLQLSTAINKTLPLIWKNRIKQSLNSSLSWNMNFNQVNKNTLNFSLAYDLEFHEFLDLQFSVNSANTNMYLYFDYFKDKMNIVDDRNLWIDLLHSFAIFDTTDQLRYDSYFNMKNISIKATHYMGNWTAQLEYSGKPVIDEALTDWESLFSFIIHWTPISKIQSKIAQDEEGIWSASSEWEEGN